MKIEVLAQVEVDDTFHETTVGTYEGDPQWCERFIASSALYSPSLIFRVSDTNEFGDSWTKTWTLSDVVSEPDAEV